MTGPEHYQEAERLLQDVLKRGPKWAAMGKEAAHAAAQVHATLALAAATALGTSPAEGRAWAAAAGTRLSEDDLQAQRTHYPPAVTEPEDGPVSGRTSAAAPAISHPPASLPVAWRNACQAKPSASATSDAVTVITITTRT